MFDNQVWLALALIGTFLTIFVVGVVVDMMLSIATVQTQVGATPDSITNLRQEQLRPRPWNSSSSRSRAGISCPPHAPGHAGCGG
jgi:hypothetical protein